ncbi:MAG: ribosome biogenesis GTP-binding protein YihA/YsxC [Gemmatimonadota bacterium]|nr:ribosome biogenesis GTP-binding protein YihA/YsxC [Gemmatimonadota bacterium]MDE2873744.1 ribosome biogenesis GTP-binding protein YihA/YsxC [Gemmatimonadota bacterium]
MIIRSVEFAGSVVAPQQPCPGDLPQVAFAGRSNVGKSSLINRVLGRPRRKVARVSASPGKTQALNFYEVNGSFFLVDLPGSGYAKAPRAVRESWRVLVRGFLAGSEHLRGVVYLVDSRHPPTRGDREFVEYLAETGVPALIALTKVDKLKAREREKGVERRVTSRLGVSEDQVVASSARTGEGAEELLEAIAALLESEEES